MGHATHENKASKCFYWSKERGMQNLNSMIEEGSGWNIIWGKDINNLGQIVAYGIKNNEVPLVILNPIKTLGSFFTKLQPVLQEFVPLFSNRLNYM
jgi:hypothetical protein